MHTFGFRGIFVYTYTDMYINSPPAADQIALGHIPPMLFDVPQDILAQGVSHSPKHMDLPCAQK